MDLSDLLSERIDKKTTTSRLNKQLGLENLKRHSFENTISGNGITRPDGQPGSSVLSGSIEDPRINGGKPTLVPFLYEGKVVGAAEAGDLAVASGRIWPAFKTNEEATAASKKVSSRLGKKK
jgi:hypothetical protein